MPLERAIPVAEGDRDRAHLDAMRPRIAHQLRRCVEAHGLTVDERRAERRGVMMFQPGGGIDEERKARRMRLRKSIFAESQNLVEYLVGISFRITARLHAVDQLLLKRLQAAFTLPSRHRAPQTIGLAG